MATQSDSELARTDLLNQVVTLREQLNELDHRDCHSCYVCFDDWKGGRKRCYDRQYERLSRELLIAVTDLVSTDSGSTSDSSNPPSEAP